MTEPPILAPPSPNFMVIRVDALSAALAKLQVGITAAQLLDAINQEECVSPPPGMSSSSEASPQCKGLA